MAKMAQFSPYVVGTILDRGPSPIDHSATSFVEYGSVKIGVQFRRVDSPEANIDAKGVALHVLDAKTNLEYLRFDCFPEDPHYHYIQGGATNRIVAYDSAACGQMLPWALECVRLRLREMLQEAGANSLADEWPQEAPEDVMEKLTALAWRTLAIRSRES
jgi:hypothetical protein